MARPPLVLLLAVVLAIGVLVPVLLLSRLDDRRDPPAMAAGDPAPSAAPTAPGQVGEALDPAAIPWMYVAQAANAAPGSFDLQAGRLGDAAPIVDREVPWTFDPMTAPGRRPAAGQSADGSVVYVEDDGQRSHVRRLALHPDAAPEPLGEVEDIVWSIAVTRDGRHAYLALAARNDPGRHTGVMRLALDGRGAAEQVMDAAPAADHAVRNMAVSSLVEIRLSADDRQLLRQLCTPAVGCGTDVLDIGSGRTLAFGETAVMGAAGDAALIQRCGQTECTMEVVDLRTGEAVALEGPIFEAVIVAADGTPAVAAVTGDPMAADARIELFDPTTGARDVLFRPQPPAPVSLILAQAPLTYTAPPGYLLASVAAGEAGAVAVFTTVAIPLAGGEPLALPAPPVRHEPAPGVQG